MCFLTFLWYTSTVIIYNYFYNINNFLYLNSISINLVSIDKFWPGRFLSKYNIAHKVSIYSAKFECLIFSAMIIIPVLRLDKNVNCRLAKTSWYKTHSARVGWGSLRCYICKNAVILKLFPSALDLPYNRGKMIGLLWFGSMVISASFINISVISWRSVLLLEENWWNGENHRPAATHCQILSYNVVYLALSKPRTCNINDDRHWLHR